MKRIILILFVFIVLMLEAKEFAEFNEIHRGMKGYALTVFEETDIDTIQLEVIDIVRNYNGSQDVILVKCLGENIEKTGIAQGMSGSPVYFNNKLAGALSYTWANMKEPIAGVTAINDMLKINEFEVHGKNGIYKLQGIMNPIILNGVSDKVIESVKDYMPSSINGFTISGSGSSEYYDKRKSNIKPGSAVAVKIVEGDMNASAIGTCTYKDGDKLYLFGHPFYMKGEIQFPVSEAYIYTILAKTDLSYKIGIPFVDNEATAVQDRMAGVLALKNIKAPMIPVKFILNEKKNVNLNFVRDEDLISSLLPLMFIQSLFDNYKSAGSMTVQYDISIFSKKSGNVNYENMVSSDFAPIFAYIDIQSILYAYTKNIFKAPLIDSISINAEIREDILIYSIQDIIIPKKYYSPGETINGSILLSKLRGNEENIKFTLNIPDNIQGDSIILVAISGRDEPIFELSRSEGMYDFTNFDELRNIITKLKPANSIIVKLIDNKTGFVDVNKEYTKLTRTKITQMLLMGKKQVYAGLLNEEVLSTSGVITGQSTAIIKIRR